MRLEIVYEDNHLIAVNKPAGWLVQGDETGDTTVAEIVKKYIKRKYSKPGDVWLGIIHRIDRPVSGVVIFARTSKALTRMNKLFQERNIEKTYWAITTHRPDPENGELTHYIRKDKTKNVARAYDRQGNRTQDAKKSHLSYRLMAQVGSLPLMEVKPTTGRPHQIRVQMASIKCPIRGDLKYGAYEPNHDKSICLHSRSLSFEHPVKKEPVYIEAGLPTHGVWKEFYHLMKDLKTPKKI